MVRSFDSLLDPTKMNLADANHLIDKGIGGSIDIPKLS